MNTNKLYTISFKDMPLVYIEDNNGNYFIAIKPICDVLNIDDSRQKEKIKSHPIYGSTYGIKPSVGADDKKREMACIPLKYVFGWLLGIDSRKVKPEAAGKLLKYQIECHDVLYNHFVKKLQNEINLIRRADKLDKELKETRAEIKSIRVQEASIQTRLNV